MGKHGTPDWGVRASQSVVYSGINMAELAARLESIVTHDRRGDVVWFDDFSRGIEAWNYRGWGTDNAQEWDHDYFHTGMGSFKHTTGKDGNKNSRMVKSLAYATVGKFGYEFCYYPTNFTGNTCSWEFFVYFYDGTTLKSFQIRYKYSNRTFYYLDSAGVWQALTPTLKLYSSGGNMLWHYIKLVVDVDTGKYVRLIANNLEFDLSSFDGMSNADGSNPEIEVSIYFITSGVTNKVANVNHFIATRNEP